MAHFTIDGIGYGLVFGSDVINDGVFLELSDVTGVVLVAFRSDKDGKVTLTAFREKLPLRLVERFLHAVRKEWPDASQP